MNAGICTLLLLLRWLTFSTAISTEEFEFDNNPDLQLVHDSTRKLESGRHVHYNVPANIHSTPTALKVVLESLAGDADLYVSSSAVEPKPTYNSYYLKAASYGVDIVNVPVNMKRPLAIGVYSHPNYKSSMFRMRIYIDHYNSVDEFYRAQLASSSDGLTYEELVNMNQIVGGQKRDDRQTDRSQSKSPRKDMDIGNKKTAHRTEEKSSWVATLLLHILEFLLEVFL